MSKSLNIVHLYANQMNIYGDTGNVLALQWRLDQRGMTSRVNNVGVGERVPANTDIIVAGGGQDSGQFKIEEDLQRRKKELRSMHDDGVVYLAICGMYQLLGHRFKAEEGNIEGVGIFDLETVAGESRLIGNTLVKSAWGNLVGFENHSGRTYLANPEDALGKVTKGAGNNDEDYTEGCISKNAFGTYMHGPALPKNPRLADELISRALVRKYGKDVQLAQIDDSFSVMAAKIASKLPR